MSPKQLRELRLATTSVAIHLGRISEDSDTSFPSEVSIFFICAAKTSGVPYRTEAGLEGAHSIAEARICEASESQVG